MHLMDIEYEATFTDINKDEMRRKLEKAGAKLVRPEFLQTRVVYNLPKGHEIDGGWLRVRDEGDKITMSLKVISDANRDKIDNQKEICLTVDNQKDAEEFLKSIGCTQRAYQESKREIWNMDDVEVCIDEWPFLEPFVEIEGDTEESVRKIADKLGFNYKDALFFSVDAQYSKKYGIPIDVINDQTPKLIFNMDNPLLKIRTTK